ncbi:hypothetical protein IAD21_04232 [Abditibacteriota bacterium]|nr:hypothetical protein IAD21_04232 [Abditibacteriota bacterium]
MMATKDCAAKQRPSWPSCFRGHYKNFSATIFANWLLKFVSNAILFIDDVVLTHVTQWTMVRPPVPLESKCGRSLLNPDGRRGMTPEGIGVFLLSVSAWAHPCNTSVVIWASSVSICG